MLENVMHQRGPLIQDLVNIGLCFVRKTFDPSETDRKLRFFVPQPQYDCEL